MASWLPHTPLPPASSIYLSPLSLFYSITPVHWGVVQIGKCGPLDPHTEREQGSGGGPASSSGRGFLYERTHIRTPTLGSMALQKPTQVQLLMLFP